MTRGRRRIRRTGRRAVVSRIWRHIQGIPELGIPTVRMINGGTGVRGGDCMPDPVGTGFPSTRRGGNV